MPKKIIANRQTNFDISIFEVINEKVNLTKMCNHFGKRVDNWRNNKSTKIFLNTLQKSFTEIPVIEILKGGNGDQGTFGTREVALKLAQWISPDFEVFCIKKLDELFQTGKVELKPKIEKSESQLDFLQGMLDFMKEQTLKVNKLEENDQKQQEKLLELESKATGVTVDINSVKDYKTIKQAELDYLGREINYFVNQKYVESKKLDFRDAHREAWKDYKFDTGFDYAGAKFASKESKKHFLEWIKSV